MGAKLQDYTGGRSAQELKDFAKEKIGHLKKGAGKKDAVEEKLEVEDVDCSLSNLAACTKEDLPKLNELKSKLMTGLEHVKVLISEEGKEIADKKQASKDKMDKVKEQKGAVKEKLGMEDVDCSLSNLAACTKEDLPKLNEL